jgi:hypothetical protein
MTCMRKPEPVNPGSSRINSGFAGVKMANRFSQDAPFRCGGGPIAVGRYYPFSPDLRLFCGSEPSLTCHQRN